MVTDWTSTTEFLPCQVQPGPAHDPWPPLATLKPSNKVKWVVLSTHIDHTVTLDDLLQLQHFFYLLVLCSNFNSPCKTQHPTKVKSILFYSFWASF